MMEALIFGWPQIVYLVLLAMGFGVTLANHGKPREPHNIITSLCSIAIMIPILYFGGFFTA